MTEEERSHRQRVFTLIASARNRVNPTTTEHIAEVAMRNADEELHSYVAFLGWKHVVGLQEDDARAHFRPTRSGHRNKSGRFGYLRSILEMPERVGELAKPLGELALEELRIVIAGYASRAQAMEAEVIRLSRIAEAMEAEGLTYVKELGAKRVQRLYTKELDRV
jgi:hypothetical protein